MSFKRHFMSHISYTYYHIHTHTHTHTHTLIRIHTHTHTHSYANTKRATMTHILLCLKHKQKYYRNCFYAFQTLSFRNQSPCHFYSLGTTAFSNIHSFKGILQWLRSRHLFDTRNYNSSTHMNV